MNIITLLLPNAFYVTFFKKCIITNPFLASVEIMSVRPDETDRREEKMNLTLRVSDQTSIYLEAMKFMAWQVYEAESSLIL